MSEGSRRGSGGGRRGGGGGSVGDNRGPSTPPAPSPGYQRYERRREGQGKKTREGKKAGDSCSHTPLPCYAGSADFTNSSKEVSSLPKSQNPLF